MATSYMLTSYDCHAWVILVKHRMLSCRQNFLFWCPSRERTGDAWAHV